MIERSGRRVLSGHWLILILAGATALACSPDGDDTGGAGGSAGTSGTTGATSGTGPAGSSGASGTSGASGASGTDASGGTAGSAGTAGSGAGVGGTPGGGSGGIAGSDAGTGGASGAGTGGNPDGGTSGDGTGGSMSVTLVEPIERSGKYVLEFGDLFFEVDPAVGARITSFKFAGTELLTGPAVNADNFGSTFWTSPQATWNWPPPPEVDTGAYTPAAAAPSITFTGAAVASGGIAGVTITKKFTANLEAQTVLAEYTITSASGGAIAPWEITRVPSGGLTFYPTGTGEPTAGGTFPLPTTTTGAGCTWFQYPAGQAAADQKLLADGSGGWLAHVTGDIVLVKKFMDVPAGAAATGEAEIELFVSGSSAYVEVEQQGAVQTLAAGGMLTWPVTWIARRLPAGLTPSAGSQELVDFVQSLVQ